MPTGTRGGECPDDEWPSVELVSTEDARYEYVWLEYGGAEETLLDEDEFHPSDTTGLDPPEG